MTARAASVALASNADTYQLLGRLRARGVERLPDTALDHSWLAAPAPRSGDCQRIIWAGRLESHKGPLLALDAFARVQRGRDVRLVVAGEGPMLAACQKRAARLGIEDRVEFLGQVPRLQLRHELLNSDVLLFTSLRDSYPPILIEAMGVGLPIVALDHQSTRELPATVVVKVPVTRPRQTRRDCAAAVAGLLDSPARRAELSVAGRADAEAHHLWALRLDAVEKIYQDLVL
ncbi:MAG: glycosyltransferase family 4 protein [Acidimicrobiales bacterium]